MPKSSMKPPARINRTSRKPRAAAPRPALHRAEQQTDPDNSPGRRQLLTAAAIEFCERGFDGASVLSIARRAGVKQPLINYHFGSKEGLWRAVVDEGNRASLEMERAAKANVAGLDAFSRMKLLLYAFAKVNISKPSIHAIMQNEMLASGPRLDWLVDTYMKPFQDLLASLFEECVAQKILKPYPAPFAVLMMTGILASYLLASKFPERLYGIDFDDDETAQSFVRDAIDALFNGMRVDPETGQARLSQTLTAAI